MNRIEIILPKTKDNPGDIPIINIKLEKNLPDGYAAEISAKGTSDNDLSNSYDLITKLNRVYLSLFYSLDYKYTKKRENNKIRETLDNSVIISKQVDSSKAWGNKMSHNLGIGSSYSPTKYDNLRGSLSTSILNENTYRDALSVFYDYNNVTSIKTNKSHGINRIPPKLNGNFAYSHYFKNKDILVFSYNLSHDNNKNNIILKELTNDNQIDIRNNSENSSSLNHSIGLSFLKRYKKNIFEISAEYLNRIYYNSSRVEYNDALTDLDFINVEAEGLDYRQSILSFRSRFNHAFKKFYLDIVLLGEDVATKGVFHNINETNLDYHEFQIAPTINIIYRTSDRTRVTLSYDKRSFRPNIYYLNPYENQSDPYNIVKGNPELKSEISHNFRLSLNKTFHERININFQCGVALVNNAIEQYTSMENNNISITTYKNIADKKEIASSLSISLIGYKKFYISNRAQFVYNSYTNDLTNFHNKTQRFANSTALSLNISKGIRLSADFSVFSSGNLSQTKMIKYYTKSSVNISSTLIKDKLFINIGIIDPYKNYRKHLNTIGDESFRIMSTKETPGRMFSLSVRWNFGRLKEKQSLVKSPSTAPDLVRPSLITK